MFYFDQENRGKTKINEIRNESRNISTNITKYKGL